MIAEKIAEMMVEVGDAYDIFDGSGDGNVDREQLMAVVSSKGDKMSK